MVAMPKPFPSPTPRTAVQTEETARLQTKIMALRRAGWSFPKIAVECDRTQKFIYTLYKKGLRSIIQESVEDVRKMEMERLDMLYKEAARLYNTPTPLVNGGAVVRDVVEDEEGNLKLKEDGTPVTVRLQDLGPKFTAMDKMLKVMERRANLLGLDAPKRKELTGSNGKPIEYYQRLTLRGLSKKELETMRALAEKAAASGDGAPLREDDDEDESSWNDVP